MTINVTYKDIDQANLIKAKGDPISIAIKKAMPNVKEVNLPWKATDRLLNWVATSKMSPFSFEINV